MAKHKSKSKPKSESVITSFTSGGEYFAILYPNGNVKVWNTEDGSLFSEWKASGNEAATNYSCMALSCNKKKSKKGWNCLLALGTNDGQVMVIDVSTRQIKWESSHHSGELAGVSFVNKGKILFALGKDGLAIEMNSGSGEVLKEHRISKRPLSSFAFSSEKKVLALVEQKIRVMGVESGEELLKLSDDMGSVQHISLTDDAKNMFTSSPEEKCIRVWMCDLNTKNLKPGPSLPIKKPATTLECLNGCNDEDNSIVLAVSGPNVAYIWSLSRVSQDDIKTTKVRIKAHEGGTHAEDTRNSYSSLVTARLHAIQTDNEITVLIVHSSIDSPKFSYVRIKNPGEDIVVSAMNDTGAIQEIGGSSAEVISHMEGRKSSKKRAASDAEILNEDAVDTGGHGEIADGAVEEDDLNELTMGEKLEELTLLKDGKKKSNKTKEPSPILQPPSADSVNVLLKQALRADDRALLLDCLYTHDEKVIAKSIALLNPSDVSKLLQYLVSIIHSRGAVLVCALPWLIRLIIQHASGMMSQESNLAALNSLYQLIESRVATFQPVCELSSRLHFHCAGDLDDEDEDVSIKPVIYEDKDDSDEEEPEDAMETDHENNEEEASDVVFEDFSDVEGIEEMSD